jgi:hypothetical protein
LTEAEGEFHLDLYKEKSSPSIDFEGKFMTFAEFVGMVYNNVARHPASVIHVVDVDVIGGRVVTLDHYIKSNDMAITRSVRLRRPAQKFPADLPKTAPRWYGKYRRKWPAGFGTTGEELEVSATLEGVTLEGVLNIKLFSEGIAPNTVKHNGGMVSLNK